MPGAFPPDFLRDCFSQLPECFLEHLRVNPNLPLSFRHFRLRLLFLTLPETLSKRAAESGGLRIWSYTDCVSKNLTLRLGEELLGAVRKVAVDRNTSVRQMVRDYLERVVRDADQKQAALARPDAIFRAQRIEVGRQRLRRLDVHER